VDRALQQSSEDREEGDLKGRRGKGREVERRMNLSVHNRACTVCCILQLYVNCADAVQDNIDTVEEEDDEEEEEKVR